MIINEKSKKRKIEDVIDLVETISEERDIKKIIKLHDKIISNTINSNIVKDILNHFLPNLILNLTDYINWFSISKSNRSYIKTDYIKNIYIFIIEAQKKNES